MSDRSTGLHRNRVLELVKLYLRCSDALTFSMKCPLKNLCISLDV